MDFYDRRPCDLFCNIVGKALVPYHQRECLFIVIQSVFQQMVEICSDNYIVHCPGQEVCKHYFSISRMPARFFRTFPFPKYQQAPAQFLSRTFSKHRPLTQNKICWNAVRQKHLQIHGSIRPALIHLNSFPYLLLYLSVFKAASPVSPAT